MRIAGHNHFSCLQAVHVRHVDIHADHIRFQRFQLGDGIAAVAGFTAYLQIGIRRNNALQDLAHEG